MIKENFMLIADGYKYFHNDMYPSDVDLITSTTYIRNPKMDLTYTNGRVCVFGVSLVLQRIERMLKDFVETFSYEEMKKYNFIPENMVYNFTKLYMYLKDSCKDKYLNKLLDIKYVNDGTFLKPGDRVLVIKNKDKEFRWLPNYLETFINSELWKGTYIATQAASYLGAIVKAYFDFVNSEDMQHSDYERHKLIMKDLIYSEAFKNVIHDFSARGMSGLYDVIFHNVAHLMFFNGTDSVAIDHLRINGFYSDLKLEKLIPASEHSVMCSYNNQDPQLEVNSITKLMRKYADEPISLVCDSTDIFQLLENLSHSVEFKELLKTRNSRNPLVIRGDSGDPVKIMTGNSAFETESYEVRNRLEGLGLVRSLKKLFPDEFKSFSIKAIYGDAITPQRTYEIFLNLLNSGIENPEDHIVLGAGSYTYNYATRDSVGLVTKATSYTKLPDDYSEGYEKELVKNPKTDPKKSSLNINKNKMISFYDVKFNDINLFIIPKTMFRENFIEEVIEC